MSLEQTIGNLEIRYANVVTFVGSSNTMVDTTTGRIQTKGIQHNSNVITDISGPHGRIAPTLKKYPEIVFADGKFDSNDTTNTYVQAGYTVTASTTYSTHRAFKAFNGVPNDFFHWQNGSFSNSDGTYSGGTQSFESTPGEWLKIEVPNKIKPTSINLYRRDFDGQSPKDFKIYASITGSSWTLLTEQTGIDNWTNAAKLYNFDTGIYYKYFAILVTKITRTNSAGAQTSGTLGELELYGYEEDPPAGDHSVDTTFKSRFNNPQLTGVQVLVDGATGVGTNQISGGPDPSGNDAPMTSPNKYWTLNGTLTSNLAVEANTFLEGDQPHAVSVWFNSSNLEANVSNTCVFSIASEEKLDSVNLDLQSNTWHNLTYAYQGEGGSKVTYLDGRKVAEDQAEDTFGEYPPLEMTGYSQGGYVVSASSEHDNGVRLSWKAFESGTGNETGLFMFNETGPKYGPTANTNAALFEGVRGEWIKLELPEKIYIASLFLRGSQDVTQSPEQIRILGSNDDVNWDVVKATFTVSNPAGDSNDVINSTKAYKYIVLQVIKVNGSTAVQIKQILYYGHRENDLVRLPDPTNVLKYPHIPFALGRGGYLDSSGGGRGEQSYSLRGYTVTSSSNLGNGGTDTRSGWSAFDEGKGGTTYNIWQSGDYYVNNTTPGTYNRNPPERHTAGGVNYDGEWIKLELPHKINVTAIEINSAAYDHLTTHIKSRPYEGAILGSNDGSKTGTWDLLKAFSGGLTWTTTTVAEGGGRVTLTPDTNTGNAYKYLVLIVNKNEGPRGQFDINELKYFGTGVDSIPIQIGGGNIDKIANFRVYDKFIGEDQALEIWDAQKDHFGRAKSSMTLQKGRLGIGTDEPEGRLAVADEPHAPEEFPPRAMTGYKTYMEGHGEFCASASSWYNQASSASAVYPWNAFNKGALGFSTGNGHDNNWETSTPASYSASTGLYTGASGFFTAGIGGDWVQLEFPYAIKLDCMELMPMYYNDGTYIAIGPARSPQDGHIMASNDGVNWISIYNWTGRTDFTNLEYTTFKVPETVTKTYKYFRVVWTRTNYNVSGAGSLPTYASVGEIKFFGTREQGQSVLHDGELTLTKSLNVPRIGPPLDADDTPRRDRLVVEYNTSTNPTFEGAVRDTSMGKKFDASIIGNAHYNATTKTFDGFGANSPPNTTGHYFRTDISTFRGNVAHSHSVWVRMDYDNGAWNNAINLGSNTTSNQSAVTWEMGNNRLWWNTYSGGIYVSHTPQYGRWYHVVTTHNGQGATTNSTSCIYIDGVKQSTTDGSSGISGTGGTLNIVGDYLTIGAARNNSDSKIYNPFNGEIASYKLYDIVLTAEEVKDLYDMGHYEEGNNIINIEKTRVGIGLGDGVSPHEDLDVRGDIRASDNLIIGPYGQHWWKLWTFQHNGNLGFIGEDGTEHGYLADSGTVNNLDFTGQHRAVVDMVNVSDYESLEGLIVSANKNKYVNVDKDITTGLKAIQISQSLPVVSLSNVVHDKACYGVISGSEDLDSRTYEQGTFVSVFQKQKGDTRAFINSVGEGAIWVSNTNGSLESGDYITTSNIVGYGQKQDDDVLHNFTVAKITMDCDFEPLTQPIQIIKKDEEGENVLDEHGQIQWEDHPTETEKAYKVRYLTADGSQTDEANTVHTAAFVGCTYHCG